MYDYKRNEVGTMNTERKMKNMAAKAVVAVMMVFGFMMPVAAQSALMPSFESLPPISIENTTAVRDISQVAVTTDGLVYVTESSNARNSIAVVTPLGEKVRVIKGVAIPQGIAVNSKGTVFVSSLGDMSVTIMKSDGTKIGTFGKGKGEFLRPVFVATDPLNDEVYVTDQKASEIKVYSPSGAYLRTISDPGNYPSSAVVYGDMLYVLDSPLIASGVRAARIAVFNKASGAAAGSFGDYGEGAGQMKTPQSLAIDYSGRLYVVDAHHLVVHCYDAPAGAYLGGYSR